MKDSLLPNWDPPGEEWPLLFSYTKLVKVNSFQEVVEINGALVATVDLADGRCWLDGVYPGGAAAGGAGVDDACANFKEFIGGIIEDEANDCGTLAAFKEWLHAFVMSTDAITFGGWNDGVVKVRSNAPGSPNLERRDSRGWIPNFTVREVTDTSVVPSCSAVAQIAA